MKKTQTLLLLCLFLTTFIFYNCQKESNKNNLNSVNLADLIGEWKCTGKFVSLDSTTLNVNPSNDYAVYTIQTDGKYLVKNEDIFSLQHDGKWAFDSTQNQIEFFEAQTNPYIIALSKNKHVYWHITKLSNDSLYVIYDKSTIDPDGIQPTTSSKRDRIFVKQ
jgi:hypothetical protein